MRMKLPEAFLQLSDLREFQPGETIFDVGQPGDEMFVVQEGEVDIVLDGTLLETLGPERFFGELALIDDAPRSATAVARTRCTLASLNQRRFLFLVDEFPFFAVQVMKGMADRLRRGATALR
jgi:CRP-like cAMP-binding protein